jgi:hypothetical protein
LCARFFTRILPVLIKALVIESDCCRMKYELRPEQTAMMTRLMNSTNLVLRLIKEGS